MYLGNSRNSRSGNLNSVGPNEHPVLGRDTLGMYLLKFPLEKVEERPPEERENGEVVGRGRKRLGDLGLARGEGREHLSKKRKNIYFDKRKFW